MSDTAQINSNKLQNTLQVLNDLFQRKDYAALEQLSFGNRLTASDMELAVAQYGHQLAGLDFSSTDIVTVANAEPQQWSVDVRFRDSDGHGDLTLSLILYDDERRNIYATEIADIHVL